MTPVELAAKAHLADNSPRSFREDLEAHLLHGYVFSTPEYFAMGRPVRSSASPADMVNPWVNWPRETCDAWLVYLAAGDMQKALTCVPYPLPWIAFERGNALRLHAYAKFVARVTGQQSMMRDA
jgi:hypothetical protein